MRKERFHYIPFPLQEVICWGINLIVRKHLRLQTWNLWRSLKFSLNFPFKNPENWPSTFKKKCLNEAFFRLNSLCIYWVLIMCNTYKSEIFFYLCLLQGERKTDVLTGVLKTTTGLPWWRSGWESACQCMAHGFKPWSGRIPYAAEQLGPWATITEPVRLEPVLRNKRGRDSERPAHHNEEWPPLAATRESPRTETKTQHSHK